MSWITICLLLIAGLCGLSSSARKEEAKDVLEGDNVILKCLFNDPRLLSDHHHLYWMRMKHDEVDNVAIGVQALDANYRVTLNKEESSYDLTINRATYARDNGMFECRVKEGSGSVLHNTVVNLTVLIPPGSPQITPPKPKAVEGKPVQLTCSSSGGSPDPQIIWYREGSDEKLRSVLKPGGSRDEPTTSVLTINPTKEDHDNNYRCVVTSRALKEGEKMETLVRLDVDYYPRITIGPANPMRVELGQPATLTCEVDAKPPVQNVRWTRGTRFIDTRQTLFIEEAMQEDAGRYICQADNGLGILREREVTLDVLYGPDVSVPSNSEMEEGQNLMVTCNVTANPTPVTIEWLKVGDPSFRQSGDILRINSVTAANQGDYVCRAVNILAPTDGDRSDRVGNATIAVRIRHSPGKSFIKLSNNVAVSGESITLSCGANPPGWPAPRYEWRRHDSETPLLIGPNYTIPQASFSNEGFYSCQPYNRLGRGSKASITLKVYQAPSILEKLPETIVESINTNDLSLTCRAQGKPQPSVRWMKDGQEISVSDGLFKIDSQKTAVGSNGVYATQSELLFIGDNRINSNEVMAQDRGIYECVFENEVREVGSTLFLRVKHSPNTVHKESKVAFDVGEDAHLVCLMQAFPDPSFQWFRDTSLIGRHNSRYNMNDSSLAEDVYSSRLTIFDVTAEDYGDYTCKGENNMGDKKTIIKLQPKGEPEPPTNLSVVSAGTDTVEIGWKEGFNGGFEDTKYMVEIQSDDGSLREYDCQNNIPCIVHNLSQQTVYNMRVKAHNKGGESKYSEVVLVSTGVEASSIPHPDQVFFEELNQVVSFRVGNTDLLLFGEVKKIPEGETEWEVVTSAIPLGSKEYEEIPVYEKFPEKVQVRLCAVGDNGLCSPFIDATKVDVLPMRTYGTSSLQKWVGIIIACVVAVALIAIFAICCCRKRQQNYKQKKKASQIEVANRGVSSQAPPPPYYTVGRENKGMDPALQTATDDASKAALYNNQQPYSYGTTNGPMSPQHNAYLDNSYSNSNNGGSVNSQDSLWQVKNGGFDPNTNSSHPSQMSPVNDPRNYQYDPMMHEGYGITGYGDYSHYPTANPHQNPGQHPMLGHGQVMGNDKTDGYYPVPTHGGYIANGDPYASVQKPRKRMDNMDGYDVSGMPDPYMDQREGPLAHEMAAPPPPQQDNKPQISFDESLESGYSTPNSRNRRIIREIIV